MITESRTHRWPKRFAVGFGVSTLIALVFASQIVTMRSQFDARPLTLGQTILGTLIFCYLWALLAIAVVPLARRFPIGQGRWRSGLLVLSAAGLGFSMLHVLTYATIVWLLVSSGMDDAVASTSWGSYFSRQFATSIHSNIFVYAAFLGIVHAVDYHRKYRDRDLRTSRLEAQLATAQLSALRMQLHPHFLFNTLNAIATLTREDPRAAEDMIVRLSELLRMALDNVGAQQQSLRDELALLEKYLEIEKVRFGDRLRVQIHIDRGDLDKLVPTLILQPLVENAVRHGVSPGTASCDVEIRAASLHGRLELVVRDTGPGLTDDDPRELREGVGLSNTRERLRQLYGEAHRFQVVSGPDGGFTVSVSIPSRGAREETAGTGEGKA